MNNDIIVQAILVLYAILTLLMLTSIIRGKSKSGIDRLIKIVAYVVIILTLFYLVKYITSLIVK